ncbi:MAG TPA: FAD-dependent monooxygenase, partial [Anaerolineales bacterium]|nr:FAD-dependent monooxygenase [Anaerolineales bacterium]
AIQSGVEMREDFLVERLLFEGDKVTGIAGRSKSKPDTTDKCIEESARLIIGADGKHSLVAREVKAQEYDSKSVLSCAYYCYWEGISISSLELYNIPHASIGICPTNDGLTMIYIAYPISQFPEVRKDIEGSFWKTIDSVPSLAERVHSGRLSERFYGTADLPSFYRQSRGPGWSLVGDAGMSMDPVTGQGIGNAFRDAERMSESIDEAFGGKKSLEKALREYEDARKYETIAMYEFTSQIASFADPTVEQQEFFSGLARRPELANRFLGALTGSVSIRYLFSPVSLLQIMGIRGVGRVLLSKLIPPRSVPDQFS